MVVVLPELLSFRAPIYIEVSEDLDALAEVVVKSTHFREERSDVRGNRVIVCLPTIYLKDILRFYVQLLFKVSPLDRLSQG